MKVTNEIKKELVIDELIGWKCDCCGKEVDSRNIDPPKDWHQILCIQASYGDGETEEKDVCSVDCYAKTVKKLVDSYGTEQCFEVDEMTKEFADKLAKRLLAI